jgi:hypothetical protein
MTVAKKSVRRGGLRERMAHLGMGLFTNLLIIPLLLGVYFFGEPKYKLVAGIGVLLGSETLVIIATRLRRTWKTMKPLGYYFLPATPFFWLLEQRDHRLKAEAKTAHLRELMAAWPDATLGIVMGIIDTEQQERTLAMMLNEMGAMKDSQLATLANRLRQYLPEILKSVRKNQKFPLFGQVMMRLSSFGPARHKKTYRNFLALLSDAFDPYLPAGFDRHFHKHMKGPLQNAIAHADRGHAGHIRTIVTKIMADDDDKHEIANSVAIMLPQLDWTENREICHIIFDESVKRAFQFPKNFGIDLLNLLSSLEYRIFWLDVRSLRNVLEESLRPQGVGLINMNLGVYGRLCSKVLAPLDSSACDGARNARVFRRLNGENGKVKLECLAPDGSLCQCEGESLSFRGIYSKQCRRGVGEQLAMNIMPVNDGQRCIAVKASVAPLHPYEAGSRGPGRGAFFEEADPPAVRALYEYVSAKE